jgi:hypothetical protein
VPEDAGYGPPPGNPSGPARDVAIPYDAIQFARKVTDGLSLPGGNDGVFDRPLDATDSNTKARAKLVYRDVPLVTIQNTWSVEQARGALYAHMVGMFYASGMLCDSILGDDRVTSTLNSRASAIFGREVRFKAANASTDAKKCHQAWTDWWPRFAGDSAIRETQDYSSMMGFGHDQLVWDTNQEGLDFAPTMRPWHPIYTYYDWTLRCFMAIGSDGTIPIIPGNGKWVEHAPFGSYRGWIRGAIRPVVEPWMLRHFGFRDMARFGEIHGNPQRVGEVPILGDPVERAAFEAALANMGANTAMIVPRGVEATDGTGYNYKLVEATSSAWEVHPAQIDRCDMSIVLALLMVNLDTSVEGGSAWGAKSKMEVRSEGSQLDNRSWMATIYNQIARPFAYLNFGDAGLAPWTWWDVTGRDEYAANAKQFTEFGKGMLNMAQAGIKFKDEEAVRVFATERFGLAGLPAFTIGDPPVATTAGAAKTTAEAAKTTAEKPEPEPSAKPSGDDE